jgi:hypothetical protein
MTEISGATVGTLCIGCVGFGAIEAPGIFVGICQMSAPKKI